MTTSAIPFVEFPKIPRLKRNIVVTEKIDGTNAQVWIRPKWEAEALAGYEFEPDYDTQCGDLIVRAGSRNRWLPRPGAPGEDNFGFSRWVHDFAVRLALFLGAGHHYCVRGGAGIQRRYDLDHKRFSLFNAARWPELMAAPIQIHRPPGIDVVPLLYQGPMIDTQPLLEQLRSTGSHAAPGFMRPEGIVIYHMASRSMFKQTLDKDDEPKSAT